uniref:Uncharacterized protein n=1 Tax=Timema poppense TaxID=170557 RepID=A0A7R9DCY2_TIMPO|nr:unnamed protein product [Timema poppensis]
MAAPRGSTSAHAELGRSAAGEENTKKDHAVCGDGFTALASTGLNLSSGSTSWTLGQPNQGISIQPGRLATSMKGFVRASQTTIITSRLSEQVFGTSMAPTRVDDIVPKPLDKRIGGTGKIWRRRTAPGPGSGP